ncbi:hypothetical protein MCC02031_16410 [Bifidobacteriaceae bacterium MCC02031]|nr:hypothetical protein MCC02031_16410 [Bifidobacteriaceae bacterium MCC02031]
MSFIHANLDKYTVKQLCSTLKFSRSTYCATLNHVPSKREQEYRGFSENVLSVYDEYKKRYGAIKIHRELNDRGIQKSPTAYEKTWNQKYCCKKISVSKEPRNRS